MKERGSFTIVALILTAIMGLCAALIWRFTQDATSYYRIERAYLVNQNALQKLLADRLAAAVGTLPPEAAPPFQIDLCANTDSCFKVRIFDRAHPQPQWSRMLARHSRDLCMSKNSARTLYSDVSCQVPALITTPGGHIFANLEQPTPLTIATRAGTTTRLLILGSARIGELVIDAATPHTQVEVIIAGDAEISSMRFSHLMVPTLIHLVRGRLSILDDTLNLDCTGEQILRLESNYEIMIGRVSIQNSITGCPYPRDGELWSSDFILGQIRN